MIRHHKVERLFASDDVERVQAGTGTDHMMTEISQQVLAIRAIAGVEQ
jgi:hypothetical protein